MTLQIADRMAMRPCKWLWGIDDAKWDCGVFHMFFSREGNVGAVLEDGDGKVIVIHNITAILTLQFTDGLAGEIFDLVNQPQEEKPK